jgi:hypothetical protein
MTLVNASAVLACSSMRPGAKKLRFHSFESGIADGDDKKINKLRTRIFAAWWMCEDTAAILERVCVD